MPKEARVAAAVLDDRIAIVLRPGPAAVVAIDDALAAASVSEGGNEEIIVAFLESGGVVLVHDRAAGKAPIVELARIEGDADFLPVQQIRADGVGPMHVAPAPAVGIVLVEQVV